MRYIAANAVKKLGGADTAQAERLLALISLCAILPLSLLRYMVKRNACVDKPICYVTIPMLRYLIKRNACLRRLYYFMRSAEFAIFEKVIYIFSTIQHLSTPMSGGGTAPIWADV